MTAAALATPAGEVRLRGSAEYTHWVVWTLAGRDFVCLEPWTAPGDALNKDERLIVLAPGESRALWLEVEV
jgi:galactose mutarotase-like enzyme